MEHKQKEKGGVILLPMALAPAMAAMHRLGLRRESLAEIVHTGLVAGSDNRANGSGSGRSHNRSLRRQARAKSHSIVFLARMGGPSMPIAQAMAAILGLYLRLQSLADNLQRHIAQCSDRTTSTATIVLCVQRAQGRAPVAVRGVPAPHRVDADHDLCRHAVILSQSCRSNQQIGYQIKKVPNF